MEVDKVQKVSIIISIVGLVIFFIGVFISIKFIFLDVYRKEKTYAIITNMPEGKIDIEYEVNDRVYKKRLNMTSSTYYMGKKIKIYYDKNNPRKIVVASARYLSLIAPFVGILITGSGGIGLIYVYLKKYKI